MAGGAGAQQQPGQAAALVVGRAGGGEQTEDAAREAGLEVPAVGPRTRGG